MEWMRCNFCWVKVEAKQSEFHLTQCGHFYCDKCIMKAEKQCCQCGTMETISLPLKEPVSPQIAHYFAQPTDLLEKALQAQQFQKAQMSLCLKRADDTNNKYQTLKEAYWVSAENLKKVCQKYNKLKMTVAALQKEYKQLSSVSFTPSQFKTPPNRISNSKCPENYPQFYVQKNQDNLKRTDEVFRVPTVTRAPRSAGYYTASSTSSTHSSRMATPQCNYSNY